MRSENVDYVSCATDLPTVASGYTDELDDLLPGDDIVVEVVDVRVWDGAALASTCGGAPGDALQSLNLRATNGTFVQTAAVTKLPGPVIP